MKSTRPRSPENLLDRYDCGPVKFFGGEGALATIPLTLDEPERECLRRSAATLREAVASLNLK